jgi:hypothetical protein
MSDLYPTEQPGYVRLSDTSRAAAESIKPDAAVIRRRVLQAIYAAPNGATCDEVEQWLDLTHQTASARCAELKAQGKVKDSGARRRTRSGRLAAVLVASEEVAS